MYALTLLISYNMGVINFHFYEELLKINQNIYKLQYKIASKHFSIYKLKTKTYLMAYPE